MKGKKIRGYLLTRQLGAGGMGQVFEVLRDVREIMEERKQDASGIISRLTSGRKPENQSLDNALDVISEQINKKLFEYEVPSERIEFYKTILGRISPELSLDECRRAIKITKPRKDPGKDEFRSADRFRTEIQAQSRIQHPNVVRVFEGGEADFNVGNKKFTLQYLFMEYVEAREMEKGAFSDLKEAVHVAYESLKGVEEVHNQGLLHRDIKPKNILYGKDGTVKLSDFGLVKAMDKDSSLAESLTAEGDVVGTPHYIDPERASGKDATTASDVYSLGATLYYFVTGMPPVQSMERGVLQTIGEIAEKKDTAPWVRRRNQSVSTELERLIEKMLAKNPDERPTTQEAKEEMENIMKRDLFVYQESTRQQEIQRRENIDLLKKEAGKWGADHKARAAIYEQLGNLYTAENQEEINARIDAYQQSIENYRKSMPVLRSSREQIEKKISKLKKEIAFEHRHVEELNKDLPLRERISLAEKKPKNKKKTTIIATGVLAGLGALGLVGGVLYENYSRKQQQGTHIDAFNSRVGEIERALVRKDYAKARSEIKRAEEEVKDLPGSYVMKVRELTDRVENSDIYDRASTFYSRAREAVGRNDFASARASAEQGSSLEIKLSNNQFKKKIDEAKLELGESVYTAVEPLLQKDEYRVAETGLELITWLLDKIIDKERSEVLRTKTKAIEARLAKYTPQIKIFEEQMKLFSKFNSDYARIKEQLGEDKFCKREEIDQLGMNLNDIVSKLSSINPNVVGKDEYAKQSVALSKAQNTILPLKQEFYSKLISYLTRQSKSIEQLIELDDYTRVDVQEKLKSANELMQNSKAQYDNAKGVNGFEELRQLLDAESARIQSLQEKTLIHSALVKQAEQGTIAEKAAANSNLLKIYIGFGRFVEAEKCLAEIPNKAGLEIYATILELEKRLRNPNQGPIQTEGLSDELSKNYASVVSAYKKDSKLADKLKFYIAFIADKTGADMIPAQIGVSDVRDLEESIADLKQKPQNDIVKRQITETNKLLEEKRKTVYSILDSYGKTGAQPAQESIRQLQNAYKAAGYEKQADEVPRRFK